MKVTVIITTYKRTPYMVIRAFQSAYNQTYKDMEFIIVDDSPDDYVYRNDVSEFFNQKFEKEVKYISHEYNKGVCEARNTGLSAATGEMIAFLDDDDEWESTKIEAQVKCMEKTKSALVYLGKHKIVNDDSGEFTIAKHKVFNGNVYDKLMQENFIGSSTFPLIKRDAILAVGKFDISLKASEDYDMWIRIAQLYSVACLDEPLAIYHVHSLSSITNNADNNIQGILTLMNKYSSYYEKHPSKYGKRIISLVPNYIKAGKKDMAKKILFQTIKKYPLNFYSNFKWTIYYLIHR